MLKEFRNEVHYGVCVCVCVVITQVMAQASDLNTQDVLFGDQELRLSLIQSLHQTTC